MLTRPLFPLTFLRLPDAPEGAAAADAAAPAAAEVDAAAPADAPATGAGAPPAQAQETPAAPWAKDLEATFEDPAVRAQVDAYLREKQQPYITKLEQEKAELEGKAWVFDGLQEDPAATLREVAEQVYDVATADRIVELLEQGKSVEAAEAQAVAEASTPEAAAAKAADQVDLDKLPPEVREAVEFARAEKARREAEATEKTNQDAIAEGMKVYDEWRAAELAKPEHAHVVEAALHAFVHAADGDMAQGLANYLAVFPAPEGVKAEPPVTLGGSSNGGIRPTRPSSSSVADVFGEIFDKAHQGTTTL